MKQEVVHHTLGPIYDCNSKILILGTMPSPKSREVGFYYSHPQNRFWRVMAEVFQKELPKTIEEKKNFLYQNGIALWDVLQSCTIVGADDNSIKYPVINDIGRIISGSNIRNIYTTGTKATALYKKYCLPIIKVNSIALPSTSPANCRKGLSDLIREYQIILDESICN